jgi:hypothetical protein
MVASLSASVGLFTQFRWSSPDAKVVAIGLAAVKKLMRTAPRCKDGTPNFDEVVFERDGVRIPFEKARGLRTAYHWL